MSENVSTLTGVLLDVSGSMKSSIGDGVHEEGGDWVRSIFQVIDNLIQHDVSASNHVFAIGFGTCRLNGVFDIMHTLESNQETFAKQEPMHYGWRTHEQTIDRVLEILEKAGATSVRKWASIEVIKPVVSTDTASWILHGLESDPHFVRAVVDDCLPNACKGRQGNVVGRVASGVPLLGPAAYYVGEAAVSYLRPATEEDIEEVVKRARSIKIVMEEVIIPSSIYSVHKASKILHGCVDEDVDKLTGKRLQEIMDIVEPLIYGRTPFYTSLNLALQLFRCPNYRDHKKFLIVVSDGMPTDDSSHKYELFSQLKDLGITTVSCFITRSTQVEPRRLFSQSNDSWEDGAKLLFDLSSKITTQLLPRTIFIKQGWQIDINKNETKLFLHINHPDIMKDVCKLARDVVSCQGALADILASVSLDMYINQFTGGFGAQKQVGGTGYANASAAVIHLSMKRILGREGGYPDFDQLRQKLIARFGEHGANTLAVLQKVCPEYRLHCKEVTTMGALSAVIAKRPAVAKFRLTDHEWDVFSEFYRNNPTGILTGKELDIGRRPTGAKTSGHVVVLTSYNSECLRLMNSWGTGWGDMGFFRVQNAEVLGLEFIDVFWTENDLKKEEKAYYAKHGARVAEEFINSLKGLQMSTYRCPLCNQTSKVTEYSGQMLRARCPKCYGEFKSDKAGNILALNMYLTSLSK